MSEPSKNIRARRRNSLAINHGSHDGNLGPVPAMGVACTPASRGHCERYVEENWRPEWSIGELLCIGRKLRCSQSNSGSRRIPQRSKPVQHAQCHTRKNSWTCSGKELQFGDWHWASEVHTEGDCRVHISKLSAFSGNLDYRPDFSTYSDGANPTHVYILEVSSRKLPVERRSELLKHTREFCDLCTSQTDIYEFVPVLVHLPSGPAMADTIDSMPHFSRLEPELKNSLKAAFKAINFLMQYTLNKCSPDFCNRVIVAGEMGAAPLQSRGRFIPPQLTREQTGPVSAFLAEKGIPRGNKEDLQQFLWAEGKWAHETAGSMTQTRQAYVKELTRLLLEKFPTLESAEEFSKSIGFEAHGDHTHSKFADAYEKELLKVLESRPPDPSKSDVVLQVLYVSPPFMRQAPSLQGFLRTLQPLFSFNSVDQARTQRSGGSLLPTHQTKLLAKAFCSGQQSTSTRLLCWSHVSQMALLLC